MSIHPSTYGLNFHPFIIKNQKVNITYIFPPLKIFWIIREAPPIFPLDGSNEIEVDLKSMDSSFHFLGIKKKEGGQGALPCAVAKYTHHMGLKLL